MTSDMFDRDKLSFLFPDDTPSKLNEVTPAATTFPSDAGFFDENGFPKNLNPNWWIEKNGVVEEDPDNKLAQFNRRYNIGDPTDHDNACNMCCVKRLVITIERHTAVMLENKHWWGIVGTMTAKIVYPGVRPTNSEPEVSIANGKFVYNSKTYEEELPFNTPTFEQKGPPTHDQGIKRAIMPGKYQIRAIAGNLHSTYQHNKIAGKQKHRGMNIFGDGGEYSKLSVDRGIDIHVGINATYTTGCILPAPGITYGSPTTEELEVLKKSLKIKTWGDKDFIGTRPTWSATGSLLKVTEMIEMIEDFKNLSRGKLPIGKALTCIDIIVKNPENNNFKNVVIMESKGGGISNKIKINSVKILNETDYEVITGGEVYKGKSRIIIIKEKTIKIKQPDGSYKDIIVKDYDTTYDITKIK